MYGIGAYFAIREAVKSFNADNFPRFDAPFTPEKVLMNLYAEKAESQGNQPRNNTNYLKSVRLIRFIL